MSSVPSQRLAQPLATRSTAFTWWRGLVGGSLIAIAATLVARRAGFEDLPQWIVPVLVFVVGLVLVWSPLDQAVTEDPRRPRMSGMFERDTWIRTLLGTTMAASVLWWFAAWEFTEVVWVRMVVTPLVVLAGAALLLAPWWMRLIRQGGVEREQRIREYERAEIAAHLHDSVLQTLTLIRARADEPDTVVSLARAQERDLRSYLYQHRRSEDESVAAALTQAMATVEDTYGVDLEVVAVGDARTDDALRAAVGAAKEAAANAARHAIGPISVYAEVSDRAYTVFVRDGGPGFDPQAVPSDRLGIKHSIHGRVGRHGGSARVTSSPGTRTEVTITVPREEHR